MRSKRKRMESEADRALLSKLVEEAQKEIRSDGDIAGGRFKEFFDHIADNLTDAKLTVKSARAAAGLSGNYSSKFFDLTGMHPKEYIDYKRVKLAQKIFQRVDVYVYIVAFNVGFTEQGSFTRTYGRLLGYTPREEPKLESSQAENEKADPRASLNTAEISTDTEDSSGSLFKFWKEVCDMSRQEIRRYMMAQIENIEIDHFYFLLERARYVGRTDRERGEELVFAALDSLKLAEFWKFAELREEKALGYACLANACKRRFDIERANHWFGIADTYLPTDQTKKPELFCRVDFLRVQLYWYRGDSGAAIDLVFDLIPRVRKHGSTELLARTLLSAADILESCGQPERALPFLVEALDLEAHIEDAYVTFTGYFNLSHLYARAENGPKAADILKKVMSLYKDVQDQVPSAYISYLKGTVYRLNRRLAEAKSLLLSAQKLFMERGMDVYGALVTLELALLYLDMKEPANAIEAAHSVLPIMSQCCSLHQEATVAFAILQDSVAEDFASQHAIKKALKHWDLVRKDPKSHFLIALDGQGEPTTR